MTSADPVSVLSLLRELADKANDGANLLYEVASIMHDLIEEPTDFDPAYYAQRSADTAKELADVRHAVPVLIAALEAVLQLHQPNPTGKAPYLICLRCTQRYPCDTRVAVSENLSALTTKEQQ